MNFFEWHALRHIITDNPTQQPVVLLHGGTKVRCKEVIVLNEDKIDKGNSAARDHAILELRGVAGFEATEITMRVALSGVIGAYVVPVAN